ncbi:MAG: response regulator [Treponema sp.]|nr:response regulator [Treponema sp.]MCL2252064.1 response regulator [Treponema sp.]
MAIDKSKYIKKYIDEGLENITISENLLFDIKEGVSVEDDLSTLLRSLHTLKGSSKMLEFNRIEELTHSIESVFVAFREHRIGLSDNAVKLILASLDLLKEGLNTISQTKEDNINITEYVKNLYLLGANEEYILPIENNKEQFTANNISENEIADNEQFSEENIKSTKQKKDIKTENIRVSLEKIDNIIRSIATLQSLEIHAKSISQDSVVLNLLIKENSKLIKEIIKNDPALAANFRKVERLSEKLFSSLRNYTQDAGNRIRGAYDNVISLRTLPISTIFDSYPRFVYQTSSELGKKVALTIEGKENEIDKNIIESLSEVFMHMVRNAIDHGLETPHERVNKGKEETGRLSIICSRESGSMKIVIKDDGRGIDLEKIREKVVREGYVAQATAASLTKEDLTNYIFQSGFSTSGAISNISGRGVGMDVVRDTVENLKGSITVESTLGEGTVFTIIVPLSIAALMGFPIECGNMKFIIPSTFVDNILLVNRQDIITVVDRPEIKYNNRIIKIFYLSQILKIKTDINNQSDTIFVVIIRSYDDVAALAVDNIDSMRSVILKKMPVFLENMNIFSGIVLNEDYEMVSVLHIPSIIKIAKRIKTIDIKKQNIESEKLRKSILVVDDSLPTREIESEILQSEGYLVDTASDGGQALKAAKSKHYDLICTDINMPVMDGFMLIENLKKHEELSKIPVIVISSKEDLDDLKRAFKLGASRYIVKNSFNNQNLLEAVHELIGGIHER